MTESPFLPGTKVYLFPNRMPTEETVLKVYKTGNFTLASDPAQQYRPRAPQPEWRNGKHVPADPADWKAFATGSRSGAVRPINDKTTAEFNEVVSRIVFRRRWDEINHTLYRVSVGRVTPEALECFEKGIALLKPGINGT